MREQFIPALYTILLSLSIYSCSEFILPNQIEIQGELDLPVKIGSANLSSRLAEKIEDTFSAGIQEGVKVYQVDYTGQTVQTFCINIPIEMTKELNPGELLKTIDQQINGDKNADSTEIDVSIPYPGVPIAISGIKIVDDIPSVSLADIAQYVITIDFDECKGTIDSGIGLNFHFTEIPDGLEMIIECKELDLLSTKPLKKGDNVFGNNGPLQLKLAEEYKGDKKLNFTMKLQSAGPVKDMWDLTGSGLNIGEEIKIKGGMRFFRVWTKAKIDLTAAIKSSSGADDFTGTFPQTPFDLSVLQKHLYGGFTFDDLEVKMYITGPNYEDNGPGPAMSLTAQYDNKEETLYNGALIIDQQPMKPGDYLNDRGCYQYQHLPGSGNEIEEKHISDIFKTLPDKLVFSYRPQGELIITPASFNNMSDDSGKNNNVTATLLIMLPMNITATGIDSNKSKILLPDMFKKDKDLFGRDNPGSPLKSADIDYIRMTIEFIDPIFNGAYLYINEKHDLFPEGISLNGKKMIMNAAGADLESLIYPDIRIEIDQGGTVSIPKNMGIVGIKFEVKSSIVLGDILE